MQKLKFYFLMLTLFLSITTIPMLVVWGEMRVIDRFNQEISKTLGSEWETVAKGDIVVILEDNKEVPYIILGTSSIGGHPRITVQEKPGNAWLGDNRRKIMTGWLKEHKEFFLIKKDHKDFQEYVNIFENRNI